MKYIVCQEPGSFIMKEREAPSQRPGEALVKITRVGICGTDLHAYQGDQPFFEYPRILGHELSGEILEIEENEHGLKAGDPAIIMPYYTCGECIACNQGKTNCCTKMEVLGVHIDGGMQELLSIPVNMLRPSGGLTPNEMALIEPLSIGAHSVRRADLQAGETALVTGCGPIGIGIMKFAKLAGAKVIAMDINQQRLDFVTEHIGVDHTILVGEDTTEHVLADNQGELPTAVFDATGNKRALEAGVQFISHGGRYLLVGLYRDDLTFNHPHLHKKEGSILASRNATFGDFYQVIDMLKGRSFPTEHYITHEVHFTEMIDHFDSWIKPETGVVKAMVSFD